MGDPRGLRPCLVLACALTLITAACGATDPATGAPAPIASAVPTLALASETPAPVTTAVASPAPTPEPQPFSKLRVFVAAEGQYEQGKPGELYVLETTGRSDLSVVAKIPMGLWPHNIAVSPNGKWVAVADRFSG